MEGVEPSESSGSKPDGFAILPTPALQTIHRYHQDAKKPLEINQGAFLHIAHQNDQFHVYTHRPRSVSDQLKHESDKY